jgi:hypothetical protein
VVDQVTTEEIFYMFGTSEERRAAREQRRAERAAELSARKQHRDDLKAFVQTHKRHRIATFNDVHLFPDCIIRLPGFASMNSLTNLTAEPEMFPIGGVQATVENSGGIGGRSTLARTMVPGAHGWQKKVDTRESWLMITGPSFQWAVKVEPMLSKAARQFAAQVTGAGNAAAQAVQPAVPAQRPAGPSALDERRKLAELRDAGIVTAQEFEATKARLLVRQPHF